MAATTSTFTLNESGSPSFIGTVEPLRLRYEQFCFHEGDAHRGSDKQVDSCLGVLGAVWKRTLAETVCRMDFSQAGPPVPASRADLRLLRGEVGDGYRPI